MGALLLRVIPRDKTPLGRLGGLGAAPEVPQQGGGSWVLVDEIQRVLTWHWGGFPPANYQLRGIKPVFLSASLLLGLGSRDPCLFSQTTEESPGFLSIRGTPSHTASSIPEQRRWHQGVLRARSLDRRRCCCEDGNKRKVTLLYLLVFYRYCFHWIAPNSRPGWWSCN